MAPVAVDAELAGIDEALLVCLGEVGDPPEVRIVPALLIGEERVHCVVEVIVPLRVVTEAAHFGSTDDPGIVQIAFRHKIDPAPDALAEAMDAIGQLPKKRPGRSVDDCVNGIQTQGVDVVLLEPLQAVLNEEFPHAVAACLVEVDRVPPGRVVMAREIRPETRQIVSFRPQMVVYHVENDGQAAFVASIDQALEPRGAPIAVLYRPQVNAVVSPVPPARKLGHRHQLNGRNAKFLQSVQVWNYAVKGPFGCEGPYMQLVNDVFLEPQAFPRVVGPGELRIDDFRRPVHTLRLELRAWIGQIVTVHPDEVAGPRLDSVSDSAVVAV